jgi:hypothetical protein
MGRKRGDGNHSPKKNNLTWDSEGNEENGYPAPDPNKTNINDTKEISRNILKEEISQVITENFMEKTLDLVNQNV